MKVSFRCKQSGHTVSFTRIDDIESMRKEPHYEEIKDAVQERTTAEVGAHAERDVSVGWPEKSYGMGQSIQRQETTAKKEVKRRGRPPRIAN